MSKIRNAFINDKAFLAFLVAGDPSADKTVEFVLELDKAGTDLVVLGIPFSDPIAESSVVQESNLRALAEGMTTDGAFDIIKRVREESQIPLCLKTYLNPIYRYGYDKFFSKCYELGIDGVVIPDLSYEEKAEVASVASPYGVDVISFVAPASEERIKSIAKDGLGFIYTLPSTNPAKNIVSDLDSITAIIKEANSDIPVVTAADDYIPQAGEKYTTPAHGIIAENSIVKIIEKYGDNAGSYIYDYAKSMKEAVR